MGYWVKDVETHYPISPLPRSNSADSVRRRRRVAAGSVLKVYYWFRPVARS
jgi:hypothetical protein